MAIKTLYSPNFSKKLRKKGDIECIVIHYTGMQSRIASIKRLLDRKFKVSCHYLIDRKGQTLKMVDENKVAWHAGKSRWKNFKNLNISSIGIELVNKGHEFGYEKFTDIQISELINLCHRLKKKFKIKDSNILGHSDIAPMRKQDPGEKFPWQKLNKKKVGIWYKSLKFNYKKLERKKMNKIFFKNLFSIGYRFFDVKNRKKNDVFLIRAFQRRFLPNSVTGVVDKKTFIISHLLANEIKN